MKFSLNVAVDILRHNSNLFCWKKKESPACMLCQKNQGLLHILNKCPVARDLRHYNARHDAVLSVLASVVQETLSPPTTFTVDIRDQYNFPLHITPTDLRPDMASQYAGGVRTNRPHSHGGPLKRLEAPLDVTRTCSTSMPAAPRPCCGTELIIDHCYNYIGARGRCGPAC